jgi:hypothetical protein
MYTVNGNTLYDKGCDIANPDPDNLDPREVPQDSIVILDFGYPDYQNGTYGTVLIDTYNFASTDAIGAAIESFANGYHDCWSGYTHVTIAIGTSNCGLECCPYSEVTYAHGAAWASMVYEVDMYRYNNELNEISVAGAIDIEIAWNTPVATISWVDGYNNENNMIYYNYGNAQGCPTIRTNDDTYCDNDWFQSHVWYVSDGAGAARPLPEIYSTDEANAKQWYSLSAYAFDFEDGRMDIKGVVTEFQACLQRPLGCQDIDNTPGEGSRQLSKALNGDPDTEQEELKWSTDMKWLFDE